MLNKVTNSNLKENDVKINYKFIVGFLVFVIMVLLITYPAYAVTSNVSYDSSNDVYVYTYSSDTTNKLLVEFEAASGEMYGPYEYTGSDYFVGEHYQTCNGNYTMTHMNFDDVVHVDEFTTTQIQNPSCDSSPGEGEDDGGNDGSSDPVEGGDCDYCEVFQCPGWSEYMSGLNDIKDAIPPPPNWEEVSQTFAESIGPSMASDIESVLGTAPEPPEPPGEIVLEPVNKPSGEIIFDYREELEKSQPTMEDNQELHDATFDTQDVADQAPVLEYREDESGGFSIQDPVDSLPKLEFDDYPMPGEGAGAWDHQPEQPEMDMPMPEGGGEVEPIGEPPLPDQQTNEAPEPEQGYEPPTPDGEDVHLGNYKNHPDDPDGSG
ncbi:hypothetical protein [Desertibacillus haloalkaliphilus]|uniref:hypothetical protein n=1 Tax=Desertibacillus haloalkaliphilus TaxID=1328930 RepID=UPI001C259B6D|nr:hypothetical protein [Desertibacillus haloalkaliphilus]MBU8905574.1 hypothetical protein [Desertibacillus haloalkaliphilus]